MSSCCFVAGLLSNLPDEVLCAELASPPTRANGSLPSPSAGTVGRPELPSEAAHPLRPWLLITDGILPECCAAVSGASTDGDDFAHVHQLSTLTACLERMASVMQARPHTRPHAAFAP